MSWRTTGILFFLLLLLGGVAYWQSQTGALDAPTPTPALAAGTFTESVPLLPDVALAEVSRLEVRRARDAGDGAQVVYRQEEGSWTQTMPTTTAVLSTTVTTPLRSLLGAGSRRTLSPATNPLAAYGLDEPTATIVVAARREEATVRHTFFLGNLTPAGDAYYLQKEGDPRVHIVASFALNNLLDLLPDP